MLHLKDANVCGIIIELKEELGIDQRLLFNWAWNQNYPVSVAIAFPVIISVKDQLYVEIYTNYLLLQKPNNSYVASLDSNHLYVTLLLVINFSSFFFFPLVFSFIFITSLQLTPFLFFIFKFSDKLSSSRCASMALFV